MRESEKAIEPERYYSPIPFIDADVLMAEVTLKWPGRREQAVATRRQLSDGSVLYTLDNEGYIYLRTAVDGEGSVFYLFPAPQNDEVSDASRHNWFRAVVQSIWNNWVHRKEIEPDPGLPHLETLTTQPKSILELHEGGEGLWETSPPPILSLPSSTPMPPKKRGAHLLPANKWARAQAAEGKTIDDLLPEYARRRKIRDLKEARELLRKTLKSQKQKKPPE